MASPLHLTSRPGREADRPMMRAVVRHVYGEAGVLSVQDIPVPSVAAGRVLVRVRAAGIDQGAWHLMAGLPYPYRLAGIGVRRPTSPTIGRDVAGVVEEVGAGVTGLRPGDEVFGAAQGGFAEYAVAKPRMLARKPANLTFAEAAAVPVSASTALQAVRDKGRLRPGQRVLVIGASGGVGTFAVQIARALGGVVTGVASTGKLDLVRSLGADDVIDYTREDIAARGTAYDLVLDIAGNRSLRELRRVLTRNGTLLIVGGEGGGRLLGGLDRQLRAMALSLVVPQRLGTFVATQPTAVLDDLRDLVESGAVRPVVDRTYSLEQAADGIRDLRAGRVRGKAVVVP